VVVYINIIAGSPQGNKRHMSVADAAAFGDHIFAICAFLDDFKRSDDKQSLLVDEPAKNESARRELSILAATAHKLANDNGLDVPVWVHDPFYALPQPVFAFDTQNKEYQEYLKSTAPPEFAQRNIFYGDNVLERI